MRGECDVDREVLAVTGADRLGFLKGLVSRDPLGPGQGLSYAALLTPQGKYICDFLMLQEPERVLLDVRAGAAQRLSRRLAMYRLRAKVDIAPTGLRVWRGLGEAPPGAWPDPRHSALGWRAYGPEGTMESVPPEIDWDAIRVAHCIPETDIELRAEDSYILEAGFERLHGVDFRKGCYVGQEVTARMKHKTELRKGLATVAVEGAAEPGTPITAGGRGVGTLFTRSGNKAIAYLRLDRATGAMEAGAAQVRRLEPTA